MPQSVGKCLHDKTGVKPSWRTGFYHKMPEFFLATAQGKKDHPEGLSIRPVSFHSVQPGKNQYCSLMVVYETLVADRMYEIDYLVHDINTPLPSQGKWADPYLPSKATH